MRIVFLASGAFALPTLRWLTQSEHDVALVVTQPARESGRGRRITPPPVRQLADELRLRTIDGENVNTDTIVEQIAARGAALGVVIAFGQRLGPQVLGAFPFGCVNLHASLLPKFRGAAPINWAVMQGEERTGCTVFRLVERMDAGPILTTRWTYIKTDETAGELHDRLAGIGVDCMRAALDLFADGTVPDGTPQDEAAVSYAPKLCKADGHVRFDRPTIHVARHILGVTPWPGAAVRFQAADGRWENVALIRARSAEASSVPGVPPGTIDERRYVATQDGFLEILEIKPSSGRLMAWADYVNGRHVAAGDRLITPS
jgi:methionyl-tRNA formyltransferase